MGTFAFNIAAPNAGNGASFSGWKCWGCGTTFSISNNTINVRDGTWHHYVGTFKIGEQKFYIDGRLTGTSNYNFAVPITPQNVQIGGTGWHQYHPRWVGDVDEVRIYNRAISASEVQQLYSPSNTLATTCTDSDGGLNYSLKGTTSGWSTALNSAMSATDTCPVGNLLAEYTCGANSAVTYNEYTCPNGCSNGACITSSPPTPTCTDSDGGLNFYIKGNTSRTDQTPQGSSTDTCVSMQSASSYYIRDSCSGSNCAVEEFYCNSSSVIPYPYTFYNCANGCSNGACITSTPSVPNLGSKCIAISAKNYSIQSGALVYNSTGNFSISGSCDGNYYNQVYCTTQGSSNWVYSGNYSAVERYLCTNGCSNGACITSSPPTPTCTDSDGGLNYSVKGTTSICSPENGCSSFTDDDWCTETAQGSLLNEKYCVNSTVSGTKSYQCPNGCSNGACITSPPPTTNPVCSDLISEVKYPTSGKERKTSWNDTYDGYTYVNDNREHFTSYQSSWYWNSPVYRENEINYYNVNYEVQVFDNKNINLSDYMQWNKNNPACKTTNYWVNGQENNYYICNWDVMNNRQSIDNYQSNNRQIYYYNGNVIVRLYIYYGTQLTDAEVLKLSQQKLGDLMNNLQDNGYNYIDWNNFNINYPMSNELENALEKCKSDIKVNQSISTPSWSCKTEPIICPEYGYQNKVCRSWNSETQKEDTREEKIYCSPGLCSGCYSPRWTGSSDNICIPYGTRLLFERGDNSDKITQSDINSHIQEFNFTINNDRSAKITLLQLPSEIKSITANGNNYDQIGDSMTIYQGNEYDVSINFVDSRKPESIKVRVNTLFYSDDPEKSYIELNMVENYNAYCNYNGDIYQQKTVDYQGNWAKCQNNYECESNICSYGECAEFKSAIKEAGKLKVLLVRMLCKLSNLFDNTSYAQCIADYGVSA